MKSRGYRNCNPGNIRKGDKWQGMAEVQNDPAFVVFISMEFGYRALCKLLRNYYNRYNCTNVRDIISRYAPANENHTQTYIATVCKRMGVRPDQKLSFSNGTHLRDLMAAISFVENGVEPKLHEIITGIIMANRK